ncbi:type I HSP40 co-chaperone YDJ1 [Pyrenophora seminiperda CCB06]|uniref:Type I HSP40 co-chaperone YDJ1 n=1 Tax=Pyrenophora seminiperda CCB06 TaxID=1302712 RepID=A0A3M7MFN7_9PLEO|nr:type I HSP40 co-chaperone YDJ1 [Pyrenophora seminiperda CCB06]
MNMQSPTYYMTLGLAQDAPPEVIRAAYKALALIYHPDKTLELSAAERATRAAVFRNVQEAYDVLKSQNVKAAYDAELERRNGGVDDELSTFHYPGSFTSRRGTVVRLTTPEEKTAMLTRTRLQLEHLRMQHEKRQEDEASMNIAELNRLERIWRELADENVDDPAMKAYCHIRAYEYQEKIQAREQEHEEWLENLSRPKSPSATRAESTRPTKKNHGPSSPDASAKSAAAAFPSSPIAATISVRNLRYETSLTPMSSSRTNTRAAGRTRAEKKRVEEVQARAEARREKKAQTEAIKQVRLDEKAALVRTEKEKQKAKSQEQARLHSEWIEKARAKVRAAPIQFSTAQHSAATLK